MSVRSGGCWSLSWRSGAPYGKGVTFLREFEVVKIVLGGYMGISGSKNGNIFSIVYDSPKPWKYFNIIERSFSHNKWLCSCQLDVLLFHCMLSTRLKNVMRKTRAKVRSAESRGWHRFAENIVSPSILRISL